MNGIVALTNGTPGQKNGSYLPLPGPNCAFISPYCVYKVQKKSIFTSVKIIKTLNNK